MKKSKKDTKSDKRQRKFKRIMRKLHKSLKNSPPPQRIRFEEGQLLPPPPPYQSWIEYAISTVCTRDVYHDSIMGLYPISDVPRHHFDLAIRDEYLALCKAASIELSAEALARIERQFDYGND